MRLARGVLRPCLRGQPCGFLGPLLTLARSWSRARTRVLSVRAAELEHLAGNGRCRLQTRTVVPSGRCKAESVSRSLAEHLAAQSQTDEFADRRGHGVPNASKKTKTQLSGAFREPTPGLEPGTPSLRGNARVGSGVQRRAREDRKVLHVAPIAVDCLRHPRTALVSLMYAESTRARAATPATILH